MFLNRLKKEEKVSFLELAHYIARSDNNFSEEERVVINLYCMEMQIDDINYDESSFSLENTLKKINSPESQKIILLEIMALVYSDDNLHIKEKETLDLIVKEFGLNPVHVDIYAQWSKSILALTNQGEALLHL